MQSLRLPLFHFLYRTTSPLNPTRPFFQIRLHTRFQASSNYHSSQTTQSIKNDTVTHEFRFFRVYESGRVEKFHQTHKIPPSDDPITGVRSKDVVISSEPAISARVFLPLIRDPTRKLPVLFHVHGGGFSFESAFSPHIHNYVRTLSSEADVIAVSVDYRLAPEHPIPACYDDSWAALNWVADHRKGNGPEPWLNDYADFDRVFVAGDSAGGNISHDLAVRVGSLGLPGVKLVGAVLVHPYFGGTDDDAMWLYMCRDNNGLQDSRLSPSVEDLRRLGCEKVLVFVAEKDHLNGVGKNYVEELKKSGWKGSVEIVENEGEDHCFHLEDLNYEKAVALIRRFASFIKHQ
ncbi:putative carboxylesterase 12 [Rosa sericea]